MGKVNVLENSFASSRLTPSLQQKLKFCAENENSKQEEAATHKYNFSFRLHHISVLRSKFCYRRESREGTFHVDFIPSLITHYLLLTRFIASEFPFWRESVRRRHDDVSLRQTCLVTLTCLCLKSVPIRKFRTKAVDYGSRRKNFLAGLQSHLECSWKCFSWKNPGVWNFLLTQNAFKVECTLSESHFSWKAIFSQRNNFGKTISRYTLAIDFYWSPFLSSQIVAVPFS